MSTITTIQATDQITDSRAVINTNFSNLNTDKMEKSANLSDVAVKATAQNNLLPAQATFGGKVLGTDGTNVSWVDPSGAAKATQAVQGITALTVAAADPLLPKAVGDNDPRVPTQDENNALAGTGTPSASNKYVTADTDALKELLSNKDTTTTLGTSDTKYPSQNAVKTYVDNGLAFKCGTATKDIADASGTQNIAHGLGRTPKYVRIIARATKSTTTGTFAVAETVYNGTTQASQSSFGNTTWQVTAVFKLALDESAGVNGQTGVVTFDATNIAIAWTKAGTPTGTYQLLWEAQ
jgi:hypothetical protein